MNTCKTCKWWQLAHMDQQHGQMGQYEACINIKLGGIANFYGHNQHLADSQEEQKLKGHTRNDDDAFGAYSDSLPITPGPDFGCVHWEAVSG